MVGAAVAFGLEAARDEAAAGRHEDALALADACLDLVAREVGPDDGLNIGVLTSMADSLRRAGRLPDARRHAESACSLARRLGDEPGLVEGLHTLARIHMDAGELTRAHLLASEAVQLLRGLGEQGTAQAELLATLSSIECRRGRFAEAASFARRGLDLLPGATADDHPVRARLHHHQGMALCMAGQIDAAREALARSLADRKRLLGHAHPETIEGMASLGALHLVRGDVSAAVELYREAVALAEPVLGKDHIVVADCAVGLAFACRKLDTRPSRARSIELPARGRRIGRRLREGLP